MARAAIRQFNKVMVECPECGSRKPKELVEIPGRVSAALFLFICLGSVILALVVSPWFFLGYLLLFGCRRKARLEAYCSRCEESFPYE